MEKYSKSCRIILCCESLSNVIDPLRSRCLKIRVPAPSKEELAVILGVDNEKVPETRNIRRAQLKITEMEWELYVRKLAKEIKAGKDILKIREFLYSLLTNSIPPDIIFRTLTLELVKIYEGCTTDIVTWGAHYQHHSIQGQKPIYHLEAFIAKVKCLTST